MIADALDHLGPFRGQLGVGLHPSARAVLHAHATGRGRLREDLLPSDSRHLPNLPRRPILVHDMAPSSRSLHFSLS